MSLSTPVRANIWHKRLGHPNGHVMAKVKIIAGRGVIFSDTLSACDTCKTKKSTKQKHPKACGLILPFTALPTADSAGQETVVPDCDLEPDSDFMNDYQNMAYHL